MPPRLVAATAMIEKGTVSMNDSTEPKRVSPFQDGVDVGYLATLPLRFWRTILVCVLATTVIGVAYAFLTPSSYKATLTLMQTQSGSSTRIPALGSIFEVQGGGGAGDLPLFKELLGSELVVRKLLASKVWDADTKAWIQLDTFYRADSLEPKEYQLKIEGLMSGVLVEDGAAGLLTVTVSSKTPWLARELALLRVRLAQAELARIKNARLDTVLSRLREAETGSRRNFDGAVAALTRFDESNLTFSSALPARLREARADLDRTYRILEDKYLAVRREREALELELLKTPPPTMLLDPGRLPPWRAWPQRRKIVIGAVLAGLLLGYAVAFAWDNLRRS